MYFSICKRPWNHEPFAFGKPATGEHGTLLKLSVPKLNAYGIHVESDATSEMYGVVLFDTGHVSARWAASKDVWLKLPILSTESSYNRVEANGTLFNLEEHPALVRYAFVENVTTRLQLEHVLRILQKKWRARLWERKVHMICRLGQLQRK